eukprot:2176446-Pyramimonas_sp.AAC.1
MKTTMALKDEGPSVEACESLSIIVQAVPEFNATVGQSHVLELDGKLAVTIAAHATKLATLAAEASKADSADTKFDGAIEAYTTLVQKA